MKDLTLAERQTVQRMTDEFAKTLKKRKAATDEAELTFSGQVNFSADDKADFFAPEKQETSINDIKIECAKFSVRDSIKRYLTQRNDIIKRNRERQKEKEKAQENKHISHPFWY